MKSPVNNIRLESLRVAFGERLQENVDLAHYTTARVGGPADALLPVHSAKELEEAVNLAWQLEVPFFILGGGSNILVSDHGVQGLVIHNRARNTRIDVRSSPPTVWAEAGANLSNLSRQVALRGLSGLEWAAAVPGSIGGAVFGNAGAFGGDIHGCLLLAEILHPTMGRKYWLAEELEYGYRSSILKREKTPAVILTAQIRLTESTPAEVQARMETISSKRRITQPPGATIGSMFKNPSGDYAGRLIEAAGLKNTRIGDAEISDVHANFFINHGNASAADIWQLISLAQERVAGHSGIQLDLEIELWGEFEG